MIFASSIYNSCHFSVMLPGHFVGFTISRRRNHWSNPKLSVEAGSEVALSHFMMIPAPYNSDICFRITTQYNPSTCRKRSASSLIFRATTELQFHVPSKSQSFNCMVRKRLISIFPYCVLSLKETLLKHPLGTNFFLENFGTWKESLNQLSKVKKF